MHWYSNGRKDIMVDAKKKSAYLQRFYSLIHFQNKYIRVFFAVFLLLILLCPLDISTLKIKCSLSYTHSLNLKLYVLITFETFPPTAL